MRTPEKVGESIQCIVKSINSVSIEELDSILSSISQDTTLSPLIDPTEWMEGGRFNAAMQTRQVIHAIKNFKKEVSGIGNFTNVNQP